MKSWSWSIQSFGYLTQANMSDLCPTLQMYVTICFEVFLENYDGQIANNRFAPPPTNQKSRI